MPLDFGKEPFARGAKGSFLFTSAAGLLAFSWRSERFMLSILRYDEFVTSVCRGKGTFV
jgi:hypothetical protein